MGLFRMGCLNNGESLIVGFGRLKHLGWETLWILVKHWMVSCFKSVLCQFFNNKPRPHSNLFQWNALDMLNMISRNRYCWKTDKNALTVNILQLCSNFCNCNQPLTGPFCVCCITFTCFWWLDCVSQFNSSISHYLLSRLSAKKNKL